MAERTDKTEQTEHDLVIEESAKTYRDQSARVHTNPTGENNFDVGGLYPDVVAIQKDGLVIIEEIETASTVTEAECDRQWKPYSKLANEFKLIVPKDSLGIAQGIIVSSQVDVTLQGYTLSGKKAKFFNSQGNPLV